MIGKILQGRPGVIAVTGQPGSGKTTMLFSIVREAADMGIPISLVLEEEFAGIMDFPQEWTVHLAGNTADSWIKAFDSAFGTPHSGVVVEMDSIAARCGFESVNRVLEEAKNGRWIFSTLETPLVGIDITYYLHGLGLSAKEIADCLSGIVSMILAPKLCMECREQVVADIDDTRLIYPNAEDEGLVWKAVGCEECGQSGIRGKYPPVAVVQVDDQVKRIIEAYLRDGVVGQLPEDRHISMFASARKMAREGIIDIKTYKSVVLQNPLLRGHHLLEQEHLRANRIKNMFSRFVTQQVVESLTSYDDIEQIIKGDSRKVTCLFCDIRGFTLHAEGTAPVELFRLLNTHYGKIINIVFEHAGTIDKFIGDSVMVVFGAPLPQEDQELRAIRCAIDIQRKVAVENVKNKDSSPIRVGISINTGEVAAGCLGNDLRMDYTVLGDTVNTASHLEKMAEPGQILMGPETASAIADIVNIREIGTFKFKGKKYPLKVFEVLYDGVRS
jgi:class 3 adenylate cyclase